MNNEIVGMIAILPFPTGNDINIYRVHRLVVLPDYQGLGIGSILLNEITKLYTQKGFKMYIKTSHIKLRKYMEKQKNWECIYKDGSFTRPLFEKKLKLPRIAYSFKYVGNEKSVLDEDKLLITLQKKCNLVQEKLF